MYINCLLNDIKKNRSNYLNGFFMMFEDIKRCYAPPQRLSSVQNLL